MSGMAMEPVPPVLKARFKAGVSSVLPRTHARSLTQLRGAYPELGPDELARKLVADAARNSAAVGATAACCALVPLPAAGPIATVGESAATSAVRTRLTAELHTVYGLLDPSPVNEGATGHLTQWASRDAGGPLSLAALPALALATTRTLPRRLRRHMRLRTAFAVSAVSAGLHSGRETRRYGEALRKDLRGDPTAWSQWPDEPLPPGISAASTAPYPPGILVPDTSALPEEPDAPEGSEGFEGFEGPDESRGPGPERA